MPSDAPHLQASLEQFDDGQRHYQNGSSFQRRSQKKRRSRARSDTDNGTKKSVTDPNLHSFPSADQDPEMLSDTTTKLVPRSSIPSPPNTAEDPTEEQSTAVDPALHQKDDECVNGRERELMPKDAISTLSQRKRRRRARRVTRHSSNTSESPPRFKFRILSKKFQDHLEESADDEATITDVKPTKARSEVASQTALAREKQLRQECIQQHNQKTREIVELLNRNDILADGKVAILWHSLFQRPDAQRALEDAGSPLANPAARNEPTPWPINPMAINESAINRALQWRQPAPGIPSSQQFHNRVSDLLTRILALDNLRRAYLETWNSLPAGEPQILGLQFAQLRGGSLSVDREITWLSEEFVRLGLA